MKNTIAFLFIVLMAACSSGNSKEPSVVDKFLTDISTLETIENANPIVLFKEVAEEEAKKVMTLSKENVADVLTTCSNYKHCVITCGDHTIIMLTDLSNCKQSGAWASCMPYAKGYIKKGALTLTEDYANNIIGIPDNQVRKVYLFK